MKKKQYQVIMATLLTLLFSGICLALIGFGLIFILSDRNERLLDTQSTSRRKVEVARLPSATPSEVQPTVIATPVPPTETSTPSPTEMPTETATRVPTITPTITPTETNTPPPSPLPPPTATPLPTETPTPAPPEYDFAIKETAQFPTNHLNFDIYVAVVDKKNKPLDNYRVVGTHSSGLRVESQPSAGDWTVNSGAMHYKGGNLKYEAFNSPTGVWTIELFDSGGNLVGPPIEFPFDSNSPNWYFLIYERQ